MLEVASVLSFFVAFALLHAAAPARFPLKRTKVSRAGVVCLRAAAVLATGGGVLLWSRVEDMTAALLVAAAALSVAATAFVLFAPVLPRALWALVIASVPVAVALALMGGIRG